MRYVSAIQPGCMLVLAVLALAHGAPAATVPTPPEQQSEIKADGRTFTPMGVDVADIGQELPDTFAGIRLSNTTGFTWYVSRHFALKTDLDAAKAHDRLEVLECAYPYFVCFFGTELKDIGTKRLPVVFGKSKKSLELALKSDDIKWDFGGGGITFERIHIAYCYPSGDLNYHQRYILIHECVHLYQMCLAGCIDNSPYWFIEGIADAISSHVYDEQTHAITLDVFDKGVPPNFLDEGLASLAKKPMTLRQIDSAAGVDRGVAFVLTNFLRRTPAHDRQFHDWAAGVMNMPAGKANDPAIRAQRQASLEKLYGPLDVLEQDFATWWKARHNTFHYVQWGWEQDRNTFWAYGFAPGGKLSQMDVLLPPGQKPQPDPWRQDYAADPLPATIDPPARGVDEPRIGAILDFSAAPGRGLAGIGLGVRTADIDPATGLRPDHPGQLKILVEEEKRLEIDGSDLSAEKHVFDIPADVQSAMRSDRHRLGLSIQIAKSELRITLRARNTATTAIPSFTATLPIDNATRDRLLSSRVSLLARNGWHRVTPFFDEGERGTPDWRASK